MKRFTLSISLVLLTLGCESGRDRPPPTTVRVVHAAPSFDVISFLRVESVEFSNLIFRTGSSAAFDSAVYTFNADVVPAGAQQPERALSFSERVQADTIHYFVLTEMDGQLHPLILEAPQSDNGAGQAQVLAVHAGPGLSGVDIFLEPIGIDLSTSQPLGRLDFTQAVAPSELPPGEYELTLTAPGNPDEVLMRTLPIALSAGESSLFTVVNMGGEGLTPVGVVWMRNNSQLLVDRALQSAMRVVNAASDRAPRDVIVDEDFSAPLVSAAPFGAVSDYHDIPRGERQLHVTPADSPGVLEVEETAVATAGRLHTLFLTGDPGELHSSFILDDRRAIGDRARVRLMNGANVLGQLDFFVVPPDTDLEEVPPSMTLNAAGVSAYGIFVPGDYELVLRRAGADTVLAGPQPVTLSGGGVYGVLAIDGDGSGPEAELVLFDDFEVPEDSD